jgi:hypothetical protein
LAPSLVLRKEAPVERDEEIAREQIEETGENPTQAEIGEGEDKPVDVPWTGETEDTPHEGEEGTDPTA